MPSSQKPECVLIVEDDNLLAQDLSIRLAQLGYGVVGILTSGEDVLGQINHLKPDLILMDIMLAGRVDGIDAARQIQLTADIPIVFLTAYADHELVTRALTTRPFAYLQKPLKERELELTLELVLLRHRMEGQMRATLQTQERRLVASTQALDSAGQLAQKLQSRRYRDKISLQRYSDALDVSSDSIYLIDRDNMRFIDVNQTACDHSGYSREELLEMGPHDIKPYFNRQMLEQKFDQIAAAPDRFGIIDTFQKDKNNQIYPVEVRLRVAETDGKTIVVAIASDMTLRNKNEQALRQSEEQFQQVTQNLQHALWICDINTEQVIYISSAFEKICGRSATQVRRRPRMLFADIHPEDRERIATAVQRAWGGNHDMNEEYRLLRSDGETRWLWARSFPIRDHKNKVYRIGGITEDITARKEEEKKLRFSEEKFRSLFENSPIGLALVSPDHRLTEVNMAFCNMLDYPPDELTGKTLNEITHPDDLNSSLENVDKLFSGALTGYTKEKRYLRRNGTSIWCRLNSATIRDQQNRPLFGLGMVESIEQIKQAETVRLARETAQKNALVREVHHRIKNHLQGVIGLMRQHAQNLQNNNQCNRVIEDAIAQINVVATIHGLQGKTAGENLDLLQMLGAIRQSLSDFLPAHFTVPIRTPNSNLTPYLNQDESVPIALALNELMVNAAKHGSSPMEISIRCDSEHATIRIENKFNLPTEQFQPGSGLELVRALLQAEGISFRHAHGDNNFMAEIILTPPIIQWHEDSQ